MFGILVATIMGLLGYVFRQKNFYECYLSSTEFLLWWTIGAGVSAFLLRRIAGGMPKRFCDIFHLSKLARRPFLEESCCFVFSPYFQSGRHTCFILLWVG